MLQFMKTASLIQACQEEYLKIQSALSITRTEEQNDDFEESSAEHRKEPQKFDKLFYRGSAYFSTELIAMRTILH